MSARRQASTTSLAKYARGSDIGPHDRSVDFCNAFWGYADSGVDVLFARMRGAARTTDELRNFWKERAAIEDEYAKRLAKLAKQVLGRDEIGELRNSLDTIRTETGRQAQYHLTLAQQVRGDLEAQTAAFHAKQTHHRKNYQSAIEKSFKAKQTQESYVAKAREKYETDCMCINSYTTQLGLVQGRDAERIHLKLERAQKTVVQNERDFANFARALGEGVERWEQEWRVFCDACQDLEEDRLEFTKDNMWAYANAVSTVCVSDDESCEKMRLALEQMEPAKDMEAFVRDYGTGNQIPDPPFFVNFSDPNAIPSSSSRPTFRAAEFARSSQRAAPLRQNSAQPEEDLELAGEGVNMTGVGAVRRGDDPSAAAAATVSRQNTQSRRAAEQQQQQAQQYQPQPRQQQQQPNGFATPSPTATTNGDVARQPTTATRTSRSPSYRVPPRDPLAEPIDPNADTFIKVGPNAYRVDLARDPTATQQQGRPVSQNMTGGANRGASPQGGPSGNSNGNAMDPLARQMEELAMQSQGTIRRNSRSRSVRRGAGDGSAQQAQNQHAAPQHQTRPSSSMSMSLAAPHTQQQQQHQQQQRAPSPGRDYRYSADAVVGAHPSLSRPASPNPAPITAAFMRPASAASAAGVGRPGSEIIADVLTDYQQSLPGERKTVSRAGSRRGSYSSGVGVPAPGQGQGHAYNASGSSQASHGQNLARPTSQMGYAGIGSGSRSSSPQPQSISRGPSPAPGPAPGNANPNARQSFIAPPSASSSMNSRNGAASPNNLGIALDPSGRVIHDEMAQRYQQQQAPQQQQQRQSMAAPPSQGAYNQPQRRVSYMGPGTVTPAPPPPPPQQPAYGAMTPYQPQPGYVPPPPPLQQSYTPAPYQAPPPAQQQQQQVYQPQPHASAYQTVNGLQNGLQRGVSTGSGGYYSDGRQQQQQQPQQHQQQLVRVSPQQQQLVRAPQQQHLQLQPVHQAPVRRSPSPQPQQPTQTTSDGKWIMFYVKALFDYRATIDEEFDFQEGDIIAVTATPEDGWWSGELLDDGRRVPGKHIFPSNFVVLF
ncbi:SH3 domain-containing protein [Mycena albidolilacea]|uniref:SH3 domain-containing protein n=1 Tax=Mycena albidolilacea TaxID=1033008 RepID=A0AAD7A7T8_9AGAR|nr:SH3 domain-containing protein [Mycena albidolilacea]